MPIEKPMIATDPQVTVVPTFCNKQTHLKSSFLKLRVKVEKDGALYNYNYTINYNYNNYNL